MMADTRRRPCRGMAGFTVSLAILSAMPAAARASILLLEARDPLALARFYEGQLGLSVIERDVEARRTVLAVDDDWLVITPGGEDKSSGDLRILIPSQDLARDRARLEQRGMVFAEAVEPNGTVRALLFQDPEGNAVGFAEPGTPGSWLTSWVQQGTYRVPPSGRIELAIWAGLHGIGLGFALPYGLGSDSPSLIGLTMMAAGPVGAIAGYQYASRVDLTRGQARLIELGGDFAVWQAVGWGAVADSEAKDILLWSTVAMLGGASAGAMVAHDRPISAGQAGLVSSAALWGGWYGLVGARIAGADRHVEGDEVLATMLLSSAAGAFGGGVAAALTDLEESRLRWINFAGILGTAFGFGLDLVLQLDDDTAVWAIPGGTGFAALAYATYATGRSHGERRWHGEPGTESWVSPRVQPRSDGVRLELLRYRF